MSVSFVDSICKILFLKVGILVANCISKEEFDFVCFKGIFCNIE